MVIYPQRPQLGSFSLIPVLLRKGWLAQPKLNGDRCIVIKENGKVELWTRHGKPFVRLPDQRLLQMLAELIPSDSILDGELINFRTRQYKNKLALFDVLKWRGRWLDKPQYERWGILDNVFPAAYLPKPDARPEVFSLQRTRFPLTFLTACRGNSLVEGVVLKDPASPLLYSFSREPKSTWLKVRLPKQGIYYV